jgi:hypothetical protein
MMMTRKDYEMVAKCMREALYQDGEWETLDKLRVIMEEAFEIDNPRFDAEIFKKETEL